MRQAGRGKPNKGAENPPLVYYILFIHHLIHPMSKPNPIAKGDNPCNATVSIRTRSYGPQIMRAEQFAHSGKGPRARR
nr:MAG TPA: hypothetical protein [Caudoviricetes sp.]